MMLQYNYTIIIECQTIISGNTQAIRTSHILWYRDSYATETMCGASAIELDC